MNRQRGVAYFGSRILRHVQRDMEGLAEAGFTAVVHTLSEEDARHYHRQMGRIVAVSRSAGLEVTVVPFGLVGAFGGEAASYFLAENPAARQVSPEGEPLPGGCLAHPDTRRHLLEWLDTAAETGANRVMWDEPHWRFAISAQSMCRCVHCLSDPRRDLPWRAERVMIDLLGVLVAETRARGLEPVICLSPEELSGGAIRDWSDVARIPGLAELSTDPYWARAGVQLEPFVAGAVQRLQAAVRGTTVDISCWIQGFGLGPENARDVTDAVTMIQREGIERIWTWGYEACGHMSSLGTRDAKDVWRYLISAMVR